MNAERLRLLLHYDPDTGVFTNRVTRGARAPAGAVAGSPDADGYLQIRVDGQNCKAHRLAWLYMTGEDAPALLDHRNGLVADNRWDNIRPATPAINSQNQHGARCDNTTGLLGASYDAKRGKYLAQISVDGRKKNLGRYPTALEAHAVYLTAKRQHHEGNTL